MEPDPILEFIARARNGFLPQSTIDREIANRTSGVYTSASAYEADQALRAQSGIARDQTGISGRGSELAAAAESVAATRGELPITTAYGAMGRGLMDEASLGLARRFYGAGAAVLPGGLSGQEAKDYYDSLVEADRENFRYERMAGQGAGILASAALPVGALGQAGRRAVRAGRIAHAPEWVVRAGRGAGEVGEQALNLREAARAGAPWSGEIRNAARQLAPVVGVGAAEGGLIGYANTADDATPFERMEGMLRGAGVGAGSAAVFGGLMGAGSHLLRGRNIQEEIAGAANYRLAEAIREGAQLPDTATRRTLREGIFSNLNDEMIELAPTRLFGAERAMDLRANPAITEVRRMLPESFEFDTGNLRTVSDWRAFHTSTEKAMEELNRRQAPESLKRRFRDAVNELDAFVSQQNPEAAAAYRSWAVASAAREAEDEARKILAGAPQRDITAAWEKYDPSLASNARLLQTETEVAEAFRAELMAGLVNNLQNDMGAITKIDDRMHKILEIIGGENKDEFVREVFGNRTQIRNEEFLRRISEGLTKFALFVGGGSSVLGMALFGG